MKANQDKNAQVYYVVLAAEDGSIRVTTQPEPDDQTLFITRSPAEAWAWPNKPRSKPNSNQPPEDLTCSTS
jgi:hypothetical protein